LTEPKRQREAQAKSGPLSKSEENCVEGRGRGRKKARSKGNSKTIVKRKTEGRGGSKINKIKATLRGTGGRETAGEIEKEKKESRSSYRM